MVKKSRHSKDSKHLYPATAVLIALSIELASAIYSERYAPKPASHHLLSSASTFCASVSILTCISDLSCATSSFVAIAGCTFVAGAVVAGAVVVGTVFAGTVGAAAGTFVVGAFVAGTVVAGTVGVAVVGGAVVIAGCTQQR